MRGMKKENDILLHRLLEKLNGPSGDVSPAPRSEPNQVQLPRFRLGITSKVKDKVGKGESILTEHGDPINIVLYEGGNVIANNHPLASAAVMMVVVNGEFDKDDIKYNWEKKDFEESIIKPRKRNSTTGNGIIESIVSGGTFNLTDGSCSLGDAKISENSSNKKVRLGVMVVSPTEERVLEGLSNHFLVRDPPKKSRKSKLARVDVSSTPGNNIKPARVDGSSTPRNNTEQATGSSTPENSTHGANLQFLQQPPSSAGTAMDIDQGVGHFGADLVPQIIIPPGVDAATFSNMLGSTGFEEYFGADSSTIGDRTSGPPYSTTGFPVQLLWVRSDVEPSKCWNLLDQLMPLCSRQPKNLMKMMSNLRITTIPKLVMQTHLNRGVLIQSLEPDDSDDEPLLKKKLHNKYQLRFVNKVCEAYYTQEQIKADDGDLLTVALYDENNSKITSGPLSSASVEVVVLHGDFNAKGQDYWTSEEFSSCVVRPQSGKGQSVLAGDLVLDLVDGEASVGYAFFQKTSSFARTGKFKMGVKMKTTLEDRIQEGISESFSVTSRQGKGFGDLGEHFVPPYLSLTSDCISNSFGLEEYIIRPVQLLWDRPDVEPSKRWNLLDQLMPLYSRQPKIHSGDFPTVHLMPEHYDSLTAYPQGPYQRLFLMKMVRNLQITTIPKEVVQTRRNRGVLIQPLEPDDSDDEHFFRPLLKRKLHNLKTFFRPPLKRKLHNKYQLRFVNKVCEAYYTREQIKADDDNLLNVALYDENNSKITSGPLSSASVEVVVLHGDFNANGQDYWTSEEFSSCVVRPQSGKGQSVLAGDLVLDLVDGEASVGYAFFQKTSSFARTGKFKMGVKMKTTLEDRIQEGISESFSVTSRRGKDCMCTLKLHTKALRRPYYTGHVRKKAQDLEESKSTMDRVLKDPPAVIHRRAHPVHELKLLTTGGAQFVCDGCQEPGYGPRYGCETCNFDLHQWCALAPDTLRHPLFKGSTFVSMPASPDPDDRRLCDACGDRVRGSLYHCRERDLDLHPCCAGLAMSIVLDGPAAFELCKGVSPPCNMCIDRCPGSWFYRSHMDGEAVDIHVACVKRMARRSPEVGDLAHVATMISGQLLRGLPMKTLASGGFGRFCKDVGTVASLIIAVVFGIPTSMLGPGPPSMDVGRRAPGVPRGMH